MTGSRRGERLALVYGAIRDPAAAARHALADLYRSGLTLGPSAASIEPAQPALRLNSQGWLSLQPQRAGELATHADRIRMCKAGLAGSVPLFAGPLQIFLDSYFDFLERSIESRREALEAKLTTAGLPARGGILDYRDWTYSAFLPLPNAYVLLESEKTDGSQSFARVDCAFWTGKTLLAVLFETRSMPLPSEQRAIEQLAAMAPLVEILHVPAAALDDPNVLDARLGQQLSAFTDQAALPYGVFRLQEARI
ncbi:hypothetical protein G3545_13630 [Starkeya sp. ORNL1]|uniref:hypothetical protein n=1 Tax=Starkeya sp. ORNL1 TaxID=2709380 RepID=UPI001463E7E1|nr:hypothetical protein [Starkeya sp. ORNL1]QJP14594.1 hypothetical protein G3545_13630 [Starkeya sp. ORNL1]